MPRVIIPSPLRRHAGNRREVRVEAGSLKETMEGLSRQYPGLKTVLEDSALLSVFVNNKLVRAETAEAANPAVEQDDEITLMIPLAGG